MSLEEDKLEVSPGRTRSFAGLHGEFTPCLSQLLKANGISWLHHADSCFSHIFFIDFLASHF